MEAGEEDNIFTTGRKKMNQTKYCKHCGELIDYECIICPKCGKQVERIMQQTPNVRIYNTNNANASAINHIVHVGKRKDKWVSFFLCLFLGYFGAHKFYEEKIGMGLIYLFTMGLLGVGWIIDLIILLFKPNPYYV